ncbi:MAG: prolyl oligopeptidase family serine peptidase [Planctomycetes bacterium]|nr:prolyl oligopeptidase family serine peptidase [Planctomycetota bacterium]
MNACIACLTLLCAAEVARSDEKKPAARERNVEYGRRGGLALTMDIFRPAGKPNGAALVLIVSGGFKSSPDAIIPAFHDGFLKRGYTIFAVVPSSSPSFTVLEMHDDVCRAVRHVRHHAKKYHIDPKRIGGGGASSGGLLGLLLATSPRPANPNAPDPVDRADGAIQASANFFPPTDFLNYGKKGKNFLNLLDHDRAFRAAFDFRAWDPKNNLFERVTDKEKLLAVYREISPIYHVSAKTPPVFLIHGKLDDLVPIQQSQSFIEKLNEAKKGLGRLEERNAGHGWFTMLDDLSLMADWYDKQLGQAR